MLLSILSESGCLHGSFQCLNYMFYFVQILFYMVQNNLDNQAIFELFIIMFYSHIVGLVIFVFLRWYAVAYGFIKLSPISRVYISRVSLV
jgi:hypothetical protein